MALSLAPIVVAQLAAIRACRVKAMDETPIQAGRTGPGKPKTGHFWPLWGDTDDGGGGDIAFLYRPSRAAIQVPDGLGDRAGDGQVLPCTLLVGERIDAMDLAEVPEERLAGIVCAQPSTCSRSTVPIPGSPSS